MKKRALSGALGSGLLSLILLFSTSCTRMVLWDKYYKEGIAELEQKKYPEAENLLTLALKQAEHFGPADQRRATNLESLAACFAGQERWLEAADASKRALAVEEKASGANNPDLIAPLSKLALYLEKGKEYKDALVVRKRALAIADKKFGADNDKTLDAARNLAECHALARNYADAAGIYRRIISMQEKKDGADSPIIVPALEKYVPLLRQANMKAEADRAALRLKAIIASPKKVVPIKDSGSAKNPGQSK